MRTDLLILLEIRWLRNDFESRTYLLMLLSSSRRSRRTLEPRASAHLFLHRLVHHLLIREPDFPLPLQQATLGFGMPPDYLERHSDHLLLGFTHSLAEPLSYH